MPPPNTTAGTATAITSLPFSFTITAAESATHLWWYFTSPTTQIVSLYAHVGVGYTPPDIQVMVGSDPDDLEYGPYKFMPGSLLVYCEAGQTYYFDLSDNGAYAAGQSVTFMVDPPPSTAIAPGQLLITNDMFSENDGGAFFDPTTGEVVRMDASFPACESGDVLESGIFALGSLGSPNTNTVNLYQPDGTLIASVTFPAHVCSVRGDFAHTFYIVTASSPTTSPSTIYTLSDTGVIGEQSWTPPDTKVYDATPSRDGTVLYYSTLTIPAAVQRWDLVNDEALSSFDTTGLPPDAYPFTDMLVLGDGSVVLNRRHEFNNNYLIHYSAAGALLAVYDYDTDYLDHICTSESDEAIWAWFHFDEDEIPGSTTGCGVSRLQLIRLSDGAVLSTFDTYQFANEQGPYDGTTTPQRFGAPDSCPLLMMRLGEDDDDDDDDEEPVDPSPDCPPLMTPVGCWTPGTTPLGCGPRTNGATGCWSGFSQDDLAIGRS